MGVFTKLFGTRSEREVKKLLPQVQRIEALGPEMAKLSDEQLRAKTDEFKKRYQAGETLSLGDLPGGYTLLCCEGVSLGWGKQAGGLMKNHYPKGLRR